MYTTKLSGIVPNVVGPVSLASAAEVQAFMVGSKQKVLRLLAQVTTAVVSTGAVQVDCYARPTHGSTSGQVLLGSLLIPAGSAAGAKLYKDISVATAVLAGQEVAFTVSTAAAGGGAAGAA